MKKKTKSVKRPARKPKKAAKRRDPPVPQPAAHESLMDGEDDGSF